MTWPVRSPAAQDLEDHGKAFVGASILLSSIDITLSHCRATGSNPGQHGQQEGPEGRFGWEHRRRAERAAESPLRATTQARSFPSHRGLPHSGRGPVQEPLITTWSTTITALSVCPMPSQAVHVTNSILELSVGWYCYYIPFDEEATEAKVG